MYVYMFSSYLPGGCVGDDIDDDAAVIDAVDDTDVDITINDTENNVDDDDDEDGDDDDDDDDDLGAGFNGIIDEEGEMQDNCEADDDGAVDGDGSNDDDDDVGDDPNSDVVDSADPTLSTNVTTAEKKQKRITAFSSAFDMFTFVHALCTSSIEYFCRRLPRVCTQTMPRLAKVLFKIITNPLV